MKEWKGKPRDWGVYRDVPVCKWVELARERQVRDLQRYLDRDPEFPYYFDEEEADRAVWFFSQLRHSKGKKFAGRPFDLADWQEFDIIRPLFGWRRRVDGTRRFRKAFILLPRKNGKSTLASGIALFGLVADNEPVAEIYCASTKEAQSKIVWKEARRMVKSSPLLAEEVDCYAKELRCERFDSVMVPLGRDSDSQDGLNPHFSILDEIHAMKTNEMIGVLESGTGSRDEPLICMISTAGFFLEGPCREEQRYSEQILDGRLENEAYFPYLCTVDDVEKWDDPVEWQKANPNLGISVNIEDFQEKYKVARDMPSKRNNFLVKNLNIWCEGVSRWISMEKWNGCGGPIDWTKLKGKRCFAGLDLGITQDITAFVMAFQDEGEPTELEDGTLVQPPIYVMGRYWCPEEGLHRKYQEDGVNYPEWARDGWITTTPGGTTRYDFVRRDINALAEEFEIAEIAVDRAHGHELMVQLADDGFDVVKHAQSMMAMTFPCRSTEELILEARLKHGDDPVLRWMAGNCAVVQDGNDNIKIMKDKSGDRVDGMVALVMGVGRLLIAPEPTNFVYNNRGIYVA